jgi:hypothetical protein
VWHHRRSTVRAYLRQQSGYGEAETLLVRRHPEHFNTFGGSVWQGRIYGASKFGLTVRRPIIYHGLFGTGFFQTLYSPEPAMGVMFFTSLEYHTLVNLPLLALSVPFHAVFPFAVASLLLSLGVCVAAAAQADLPRNKRRIWSRPLVALLFFLQPIVRGWARYHGRLNFGPTPKVAVQNLESIALQDRPAAAERLEYWAGPPMNRVDFVQRIIQQLEKQGWEIKSDVGWSNFDVEIFGSRWSHLQLATVAEPHAGGKELVRCRLRMAWSLSAKVALFAIMGFELVVIGFIWHTLWQIWFLLLTVPAFAWYVRHDQRELQRLISVVLDGIAEKSGMIKLKGQPRQGDL